jgi:hypothetical protein
LNISEIVAQKHLLARITALEIALANLEKSFDILVEAVDVLASEPDTPEFAVLPGALPVPEKRKPGRPRKNA